MPDPARFPRIAPARFLWFCGVLIAVTATAKLVAKMNDALLIGFDVAAFVFLATSIPLLRADAHAMRRASKANDANRVALLAISVVLSLVILVSVGALIARGTARSAPEIALVVATLALAWLFANVVFAFHYAHLFYLQSEGIDRGGLVIPHTPEPGYWEFLYFSFTLGMTFQTSDIAIQSAHLRRVVLVHSLIAFVFNMGILAFVVNTLGGFRT